MKNLSLSIPRPCSEKWENFTSVSTGGFCSSCSKTVVDFTGMSDDEVISFFQNKPAHACGRFRPDQLKTYSVTMPPKINPGFTLLKAGLLSLLFLLVSKQTSAQTTTSKAKTEVIDQQKRRADKVDAAEAGQTLKGIVRTEDNEPLPGAHIHLKGSTVGTSADVDGRFEFPQKVNEGDVIVASFIGFSSKEFVIPKKTGNRVEVSTVLEIKLECDITVLGEVAVDTPYGTDPSGFRGMWRKVKGVF